MKKELARIIEDLRCIKGLDNFYFINDLDKKRIIKLEEANNFGIKECLNRRFTLLLSHNSDFRGPMENIVIKKNKKIIFPAVSFQEVRAKNVVSSSPSLKVHEFLLKRFNLRLNNEEATLLIGFDL